MVIRCNYLITAHQCPSLQTPTNGIVACNGWRTDYTNICRIYCLDGYVFPPGVDPESMFVCGATGKWMPGMAFEECIPQGVWLYQLYITKLCSLRSNLDEC